MVTTVLVATALGSALAYGAGGVLQHRATHGAPPGGGLRLTLLAHLAARPMWLAGLAATILGFTLHALALSTGQLAIVQPLLVSGLLFALPASVALDRHRPSLTEWAWALVLVAALTAFLLASHPTTGNAPTDTDRLAAITAIGSAVAAVAVAVAARFPPTWRAAVLGAAGGIAYGLTAALVKDDLHLAAGGNPVRVFTTWPLYLLLGTGATALLVVQAAYQSGPLAASLPPLTMLNPIIAIIVGILAFHERLSAAPAAVGIEVASFAAMTVAVTQLTRHSDSRTRQPPSPAATETGPHPD